MIWRKHTPTQKEQERPRGFDDYELRLGDLMRGERATMGKSLLDVQRELHIRASYIAAIESGDLSAFETPSFVAGFVRSYARYLNMDPDKAFEAFCAESGFSTAHGMSAAASSAKRPALPRQVSSAPRDPFSAPTTPFAPAKDAFFSQIEPRAIGSTFVLLMLIGTIGYGGWTVLNEVQRVQFAPVENTPDVMTDLDPLQSRPAGQSDQNGTFAGESGGGQARNDALTRMYRPQALDVPVLVARDAPISTLDSSTLGAFANLPDPEQRIMGLDRQVADNVQNGAQIGPQMPQVVAEASPGVEMVAVRSAWVRVNAADGSVIFEGIMQAGDRYAVPATEEPARLRVGESGSVYFAVNGQHYGPVGPRGTVTSNVALSVDNLTERFAVADLAADVDLARTVAEAQLRSTPSE